MRPLQHYRRISSLAPLLAVFALSGCASLISNAASGLADNLSSAILNQDDPETVRAGMPSYMLLMDSFVEGSPDDPAMLGAAANLYASYGAVFACLRMAGSFLRRFRGDPRRSDREAC
jgi:hypothetical protein